jgi:hypothetical protein
LRHVLVKPETFRQWQRLNRRFDFMQRFAHGFIVGQNRIFGKPQQAFSFNAVL